MLKPTHLMQLKCAKLSHGAKRLIEERRLGQVLTEGKVRLTEGPLQVPNRA
jgi:hypothetical protein